MVRQNSLCATSIRLKDGEKQEVEIVENGREEEC